MPNERDKNMDSVGRRIKEERLRRGYKQTQFARMAGISPSFMADIENGRTSPSLKSLFKISEALNVDCKYFLGDIESEATTDTQGMEDKVIRDCNKISAKFQKNNNDLRPQNDDELIINVFSEIMKYRGLLEYGVITLDEFNKKKTQLLNLK